MRIRSIKPDFFKDDELSALPPLARLLFVGLWCMADCEGRLEDRPTRIRAEVLPYDECDMEVLLSALHAADFIVRYEVPPKAYIEVRSFKKHQRLSGIEAQKQSEFPAPEHPVAVEKQSRSNREATKKHSRSGQCPGREGNGRGGKVCVHPPDAARALFLEVFWPLYPKKKNKGTAEKAWAKLSTEDIQAALNAVPVFASAWDGAPEDRKQYIPLPASWLNARAWEDDHEQWKRDAAPRTVPRNGRPAPALIGAHKSERPFRSLDDAPEEIRAINRRLLAKDDVSDEEAARVESWIHGGAN